MLTIPPKENWLKQHQLTLIVGGSLVILLLMLFFVWRVFQGAPSESNKTAFVEKGSVTATVSGYGRLLPRDSLSLISEVEGILTEQKAFPGSWVEAGETLLTLRNIQLERAVEDAEFRFIEAQADFQTTESALKREVLKLNNDILLAEKDVEMSHKELEAMKALLVNDIISQLDYLKAETRYEQLLLQLSLLKNNQQALEQIRATELKAAESRLYRAKRQQEIAQHDLQLLTIKAPRAGLLAQFSEHLEVGRSIPRGEALVQITDPNSLYADLLIPASEINRVAVGQLASVRVRNEAIKASVMRIHPSAENSQVRLELHILDPLPKSARALMEVTANIETQSVAEVLRVQTPSYVTGGHQRLPLDFIAQGKRVTKYAQIGVYSQDYIEIIDGALLGEQVALERSQH